MSNAAGRRVAWMTDLHLDFLEPAALDAFLRSIRKLAADAIVISGDIGVATKVLGYLSFWDSRVTVPTYFVLGNHDYYGSSIATVRGKVRDWSKQSRHTVWLPDVGVVALSDETALVGHGGWGDGRAGDLAGSKVIMTDYLAIDELKGRPAIELQEILHGLGDEAAAYLEAKLEEACDAFPKVLVATHVPPFREAAWYRGKPSNDDWAPHFVCVAVGEALKRVMAAHPACHCTVLCGHTHGSGELSVLPNLLVKTGGARYGEPRVVETLNVD